MNTITTDKVLVGGIEIRVTRDGQGVTLEEAAQALAEAQASISRTLQDLRGGKAEDAPHVTPEVIRAFKAGDVVTYEVSDHAKGITAIAKRYNEEDKAVEFVALMMHCEAIVGILYARLTERIHEYNGKPKEHRAVVEVNKHLAEILDVYAGTYGINPTWEAQALALMGREIKNYYQLHKWM